MDTPFLTPIDRPKRILWRLIYYLTRKRFGKVIMPLKVSAVRLPLGFGSFSSKISQLDKKLQLPAETVMLIRERIAQLNVCSFCMDIGRAQAILSSMDQAKFDALGGYRESRLFSDAEKALLDFVTLLTEERRMDRTTFDRLAAHYNERSICEIAWIASTEFYYNIGNIALNIHSDMLCDIARRKRG